MYFDFTDESNEFRIQSLFLSFQIVFPAVRIRKFFPSKFSQKGSEMFSTFISLSLTFFLFPSLYFPFSPIQLFFWYEWVPFDSPCRCWEKRKNQEFIFHFHSHQKKQRRERKRKRQRKREDLEDLKWTSLVFTWKRTLLSKSRKWMNE